FHDRLVYAAEEPVARSHVARRGGRGIVRALSRALERRPGVDVAVGRRVDRLAVRDGTVRAGAVVLATGGFGANRALWPGHLPQLVDSHETGWYVGAPGARG